MNDSFELVNLPRVLGEGCLGHDDEEGDAAKTKGHREPKVLQHLGYFNEEVREFQFFSGSSPCHVDLEHMAEQCLGTDG